MSFWLLLPFVFYVLGPIFPLIFRDLAQPSSTYLPPQEMKPAGWEQHLNLFCLTLTMMVTLVTTIRKRLSWFHFPAAVPPPSQLKEFPKTGLDLISRIPSTRTSMFRRNVHVKWTARQHSVSERLCLKGWRTFCRELSSKQLKTGHKAGLFSAEEGGGIGGATNLKAENGGGMEKTWENEGGLKSERSGLSCYRLPVAQRSSWPGGE